MSPRTIPLDEDLEFLLGRFRAARLARRAAGEALDAEDTPETFAAFTSAKAAEDDAAVWLALALDSREKVAA